MAWDEWEQLKARAAERHSAKTEVNQLPLAPGGSGAAVKLSGQMDCLQESELPAPLGDLRKFT
ncbi:hypothetical protein [Streptomyces sp. NPDC101776]|uniref:hypothetical protein n=1 Tax=Streptomyces sp. NPDC101776 TaxID=3366146 RepID=UPI00380236C9